MALKLKIDTLEGLPGAIAELYEKHSDGSFRLGLEQSVVPKSRLDDFRNNNVSLKEQIEGLEAKVSQYGKSPDEINALEAELQKLKEQGLVNEGNFDELFEQRTARMKEDFENQNKLLLTRAETAEKQVEEQGGRLRGLTLKDKVLSEVMGIAAIRKGADADVIARAERDWQLDATGNLVALDASGAKQFGKDGESALTPAEWAQTLYQTAPFLFEGDTGSGAPGSDGVIGNTVKSSDLQDRATTDGGDANLIEQLATKGNKVTIVQ